jgi:polysaccharide export outer membrane protein
MKRTTLLLVLAALGDQAWAQRRPAGAKPQREQQGAEQGAAAGNAGGAAPTGMVVAAPVDPKTYKIGVEDVLNIVVWKEPELSSTVNVRPDGMVTANLIGEVPVVGLTPDQLKDKLRVEFGKLVLNPVVQVIVRDVRSRKYYINGNVNRTGSFPLVVPTTVLEALTIAGGLAEFADKKNIVIMRGDKRLKFNYKDVIKGKNMAQNVYLENGDFIIVE